MFTSDNIENGMLIDQRLVREPRTVTHKCPHCGEEWEEGMDEDGVLRYWSPTDDVSTYPIYKDYCVACAADNATDDDLIRFVEENDLESEVMAWYVTGSDKVVEGGIKATYWGRQLFRMMVKYERADLVNALREYVQSEAMHGMLTEWMCKS